MTFPIVVDLDGRQKNSFFSVKNLSFHFLPFSQNKRALKRPGGVERKPTKVPRNMRHSLSLSHDNNLSPEILLFH